MDHEARIAALEAEMQELARLNQNLVTCMSELGQVIRQQYDTLTVHRLNIADAQGNVMAMLGSTAQGGVLLLRNHAGDDRAVLQTECSGGQLALADGDGRVVRFGYGVEGSSDADTGED